MPEGAECCVCADGLGCTVCWEGSWGAAQAAGGSAKVFRCSIQEGGTGASSLQMPVRRRVGKGVEMIFQAGPTAAFKL
jgi:hypothetical protein